MKFNVNEFRIKQPVSRVLLVSIAVCVAAIVAAAYFAIAANTAVANSRALQTKLATAEGALSAKTKALTESERIGKEEIKTIQNKATTDIDALNEKVAAFAKQAAACEVLRNKIRR